MSTINPDKNQEYKAFKPEAEHKLDTKTESEPIPSEREDAEQNNVAEQPIPPKTQAPVQSDTAKPAVAKDPEVEMIEHILEEGIQELYEKLPDIKKQEFRKKGEEAAIAISLLLKQVKIRVKDILAIITEWLKIIPGVNKYFLEQEAKIKTDKIIQKNKDKNFN